MIMKIFFNIQGNFIEEVEKICEVINPIQKEKGSD